MDILGGMQQYTKKKLFYKENQFFMNNPTKT